MAKTRPCTCRAIARPFSGLAIVIFRVKVLIGITFCIKKLQNSSQLF